MKIVSKLHDKRINAINLQIEMHAKDYIMIAQEIISNNELQRRKVKNSGSIYSLLKSDILNECLMPPIVLASRVEIPLELDQINDELIENQVFTRLDDLIILDGLQRTHSLIEVLGDPENTQRLKDYIIRIELYLKITEVGILYRMLTLNAGQTPMSLKHQIEILYSNLAGKSIGPINVIRQKDDESKRDHNDYNYSDLIEGYNSYLECNESPIDRYSLLDIIKSIGKISNDQLDENSFTRFAKTHHLLVDQLQKITNNWEYPNSDDDVPGEYKVQGRPFGSTPYKIFNRTQAITGFGAAIGALVEQEVLQGLPEMERLILQLEIHNHEQDLLYINKCLDEIKQEAKKIGDAQRIFFRYFFKALFDKTQDELFLNFYRSSEYAKKERLQTYFINGNPECRHSRTDSLRVTWICMDPQRRRFVMSTPLPT
ncbi:hypothetical protein [Azotobacter beijerinckii]|uniref:hypothetical protein n=1 Tax=Azotobacter beijerinckii TaxID=170623 RepID=UPI002954C578|nr:hypothetical protein [Azotobacter beijerinckii]MDV7210200.1 hypothetical protein [Azotobacter beijerinckii]